MYKIALREGDTELGMSRRMNDEKAAIHIFTASESIEGILKASAGDGKYLYACALEAHQTGNRTLALQALSKVLEFYEHHTPGDIELPALLR